MTAGPTARIFRLIAWIFLPALTAAPAMADMYRCQDGKTVVFSDRPCGKNSRIVSIDPQATSADGKSPPTQRRCGCNRRRK